MMLKSIGIIMVIILCTLGTLNAQTQIKGSVKDTVNQTQLKNASVLLLYQKDSTLYRFSRTNAQGHFEFSAVDTGKYVVLISYPKYIDYSDPVIVEPKELDLGSLILTPAEHLLNEVVVKGKRAVIIKGDTTEFDASSYVINANDKVDDLLKQLPGITVDRNGKITAQGKTVEKVLVDGEEFFGDDPTLVTKNVRADMVDKVQLFDKSSDQAAFTGIDDGNKTKTINIKLKEDKKKGYFGKVSGGIGNPNRIYEANAAVNYFNGKQKMAAFGTASTNGQTALGFFDAQKYGSNSGNTSISDDGGINITIGGTDADIFNAGFEGEFQGKGIPTTINGGAMYQDKWNEDKNSINVGIRTGNLNVVGNETNISQNNLASGTLYRNAQSNFDNKASQNSANVVFETKLKDNNTLKFSLNGNHKYGNQKKYSNSSTQRADGDPVNASQITDTNEGTNQLFNGNILWTKKFKKEKRTISFNLNPSFSDENTDGFLFSDNQFFNDQGAQSSENNIHQRKVNRIKNQSLNWNLGYTEPVSKNISLLISYIGSVGNSLEDKRSFNEDANGAFTVQDNVFSSIFELKQIAQQGGFNFNFNRNKTTIQLGSKIGTVRLDQYNQLNNNKFGKTFLNIAPAFSYTYKISSQSSFRINYNGNTQQPSIDQINPIQINNNPLYIQMGNPNLTTSFSNSLNGNFNMFKPLKDIYAFIGFYGNQTLNPIVNQITTDVNTGATISKPININQKPFNFNLYANSGIKVLKSFNLNLGMDFGVSTYYSLVNNNLNTTKSNNYGLNISVSKYVENTFDANIRFSPRYTFMTASLQPLQNNNNFNYRINGNVNYTFLKNFSFNAEVESSYQGKSAAFDKPFQFTIVNSGLYKTFFKEKNLKVGLKVHDLFNQNVGFTRSSSGNQIYQNSFTNIRRYFMFNVSWDFNKMGGK